ncbi:MAG: hypothetical protein RMK29_12910 [Myxococcales bacterium]|nr:hypothetical protein [Myxococcota bacterium]MDW8282605.1 hypothetical protein [Myxococcales bacterium]
MRAWLLSAWVVAAGCGMADPSGSSEAMEPTVPGEAPGLATRLRAQDPRQASQTTVEDDPATSDGVTRPIGTYESHDPWAEIHQLHLRPDGTFRLVLQCPPSARCAPQDLKRRGHYRLLAATQIRYLVLASPAEPEVRYLYSMADRTLELRRSGSQRTFFLFPAPALE